LSVKPLCQREDLVTVDLQEILFFDGGDFSSTPVAQFSNWKLLFVVDIEYEERGKRVKRVTLNLAKGARFCESSSIFTVTAQEQEALVSKYKSVIIEYMTKQYFNMLASTGHYCIYHFDSREETIEEESDEEIDFTEECICESVSTCGHTGVRWVINERERVRTALASEFDIVTAVTQGSINTGFHSRWDAASAFVKKLGQRKIWEDAEVTSKTCVAEYSFADLDAIHFHAKFSAPRVQLVCEEGSHKAILYLMIEEGHLTVGPHVFCLNF